MCVNELIERIRKVKRSRVKSIIEKRVKEFERVGRSSSNEIFKELCFCILTANFNAERAIEIQQKIGDEFLTLGEKSLAKKLKELGHRYPNARAKYIISARRQKDKIIGRIKSVSGQTDKLSANGFDEFELREWLVKNVKGLGYKEASHFLRNIGYKNLAIIDFHILDLLERFGIIKKPKTLSRRKYLEIEEKLRKIAKATGLILAELDLYLWYMETGEVLK